MLLATWIRGNRSDDPRHPNFVEGGPADVSFHGYASGNLVIDNSVERIQINDAGVPGPHNAIVGNRLRVGPLTLDNGVDNLTLLGNVMEGSVEALRAKFMPSIVADSTAGNPSPQRSYWRLGYDPFGRSGDSNFDRFGDGILDWGSGRDIYVDPSIRSIDPCKPVASSRRCCERLRRDVNAPVVTTRRRKTRLDCVTGR